MVKEIELCIYRVRPNNKLSECKVVAYGHCQNIHQGLHGPLEPFCFDHLQMCLVCGKMFCLGCVKAHECHGEAAA